MNAKQQSGASGFSLLEVIIASVLLTMMILVVSTLSLSGAESQEYAARLGRTTELTQDIVEKMRLELVSSVRTFGNDAEGTANLAVFDLAGAPPLLPGSRLPALSANGTIQKDTSGSQITGNQLFFAKLAWSDRFQCSSGTEYLVDVYRWHYYYLTAQDGGPSAGRPTGLDLVRIVSEPLIDASGIDRITDPTDQEEMLEHLFTSSPDALGNVHPKAEVIWLRGGDPTVDGTLRQINDANWRPSNAPLVGRPDPWKVLRNDADFSGLLAYRHHSIATNFSQPSFGVGRYGLVSTSGSGFPHGLEVQVVGPSSARQILLHLVIASTNRRGLVSWSDMRVVVDGREL